MLVWVDRVFDQLCVTILLWQACGGGVQPCFTLLNGPGRGGRMRGRDEIATAGEVQVIGETPPGSGPCSMHAGQHADFFLLLQVVSGLLCGHRPELRWIGNRKSEWECAMGNFDLGFVI